MLEDKLAVFHLVVQWHRFLPAKADWDASNSQQKMKEYLGRFTKKGIYPYELAKNVSELS